MYTLSIFLKNDITFLFTDALRSESGGISSAAREWVDRFRNDRAEATAEVLTFFLQACGVTSRGVTAEEAEHTGADEIKQEADAAAQEDGLDEIFSGKSAAARHLRASYKELWDKLIRDAAVAGQLQGGFFLDKAVNLVIALSTSVVRELRKVATITATQIATSLLHVIVTLGESRDTAAGQATAEEAKKAGRGGKAAGERAAAFKRQVQRATADIQELLAYVDSIFQSVFMNRFRDIDSEIRLAVVSGVGRWMQLLPATFLTATYLKYTAWAVSDKDPAVRLEAASALCALYYDPANASQLREFTDRFAGRFVELMDDKEDSVAVTGVKLVTQLVRLGHLPDTIGIRVVRLMSDASPGLRAAAADLAAGMLKDLGKEALGAVAKRPGQQKGGAGTSKGGRGRSKPRANTTGNAQSDVDCELAGVLRVLRMLAAEEAGLSGAIGEAEAPPLGEGVVALVVGSLLQRTPALRNWQLMVDWLKAETAVEVFGDSAACDLLCCFLAGLRAAAGTGQPIPRGFGKDKQIAARAKVRQEATLALRDELQPLILKFQSEPVEAAVAVALVPELKLEVFSLRQEERKLTSLLNAVKNVFFMHVNVACANACADALVACARTGPDTTRDAAQSVLAEAVTATIAELSKSAGALESAGQDTLDKATAAYRSTDGEEESPVLFAARAATCRAGALAAVHPLGFSEDEEGREALGRILEITAAGIDLPAPTVIAAATASLLVLVHDLSQLDEESPDPASLGQLAAAQATFASQLEAIATESEEREDVDICRGIAAVQADLMTVFSAQNLPEKHQEVAYRPSDTAVTVFWKGMEAAMLAPDTPEVAGASAGGVSSTTNANAAALPTAAQIVARLCACACVPQYRQLTAQLLSYWESPAVPAVSEVAKDVIKRLKSIDPGHLPSIYLGAMEASYERCKAIAEARLESEEITEEDYNDTELVLQPFMELCQKIAQSQAGFNAPASTIAYLAEEGAKWALEGAPERIDFLQGASYFMVRVKGPAAAKVLQGVEAAGVAAGVPDRPDDEDENEAQAWGEWDLYYQYCDALRELATKPERGGRAKKTPTAAAGGAGAGGSSAKTKKGRARRISFAPGAGGGDSEEEDEAPAAAAVGGATGLPPLSGSGRKSSGKKATGGKRGGNQAAAAAPKRQSGRGKKAEAAPAPAQRRSQRFEEEAEEEEDEDVAMVVDEEIEAVQEEIEQYEDSDEDLDGDLQDLEEDQEDQDDEVDVMPTEEQLPGMGGRSRQSTQQQKQKGKPRVSSPVALEASDSDSESDEEPMPQARRRRGGR